MAKTKKSKKSKFSISKLNGSKNKKAKRTVLSLIVVAAIFVVGYFIYGRVSSAATDYAFVHHRTSDSKNQITYDSGTSRYTTLISKAELATAKMICFHWKITYIGGEEYGKIPTNLRAADGLIDQFTLGTHNEVKGLPAIAGSRVYAGQSGESCVPVRAALKANGGAIRASLWANNDKTGSKYYFYLKYSLDTIYGLKYMKY